MTLPSGILRGRRLDGYWAIESEQDWSRRARFGLVRLRLRLRHSRVALVISGGGSLGSFEVGCLRFLYDHTGMRPAVLCGTSVGAILAAKLAEGDDPATGRRAIDELEAHWRGMRSNEDMWHAEPWLDQLRTQTSWASGLREQLGEHVAGGSQVRVMLRLLGGVVRHAQDADGTLDAVRQALRAKSLLNLSPIQAMLAERLDPERVARSGIQLRIGMVSLEAGELRYVTETGHLVGRDNVPLGLDPVPLRDAVMASASIPVVFPPVRLGSEHYVDGGARESLPLDLAFTRLHADQTIAVVASKIGVPRTSSFEDKGLLEVARRVATEISPDETLRKDVYPPGGWGRRVVVVLPELEVHDALTVDPASIAASIDYGYMRAADVLLNLGAEERRLTTEITQARMRQRELEGPIPALLGRPSRVLDVMGAEASGVAGALAEVQRHAERLVERRRAIGAPVPATSGQNA